MPSEPSTALLLCTYSLYEKTVSVPARSMTGSQRCARAAKQEKVKAVDYLLRVLPSSCQITGIVADGIVGMYYDLLFTLLKNFKIFSSPKFHSLIEKWHTDE